MAGRTIAIGDIHGCSAALAALIDAIEPNAEDTIVALGDYIDRGPDSRGVLDQLITLTGRCRLVPLLGDHEEMLLDSIRDVACMKRWLTCGGTEALRSYGWTPGGPKLTLAELIPGPHQDFLASCRPYHETATHLFIHAGYVPELPLDQQPRENELSGIERYGPVSVVLPIHYSALCVLTERTYGSLIPWSSNTFSYILRRSRSSSAISERNSLASDTLPASNDSIPLSALVYRILMDSHRVALEHHSGK